MRTFGSMTPWKRFVRDYETCVDVSKAKSKWQWPTSFSGEPLIEANFQTGPKD